MTFIWCLVSLCLGIGIGWAIFRPSEADDEDTEDDDLEEEYFPKYYDSDNKEPYERDNADKCNGCIYLRCASMQDNFEYVWNCTRDGDDYICTTKAQTDAIPRPLGCHNKDD